MASSANAPPAAATMALGTRVTPPVAPTISTRTSARPPAAPPPAPGTGAMPPAAPPPAHDVLSAVVTWLPFVRMLDTAVLSNNSSAYVITFAVARTVNSLMETGERLRGIPPRLCFLMVALRIWDPPYFGYWAYLCTRWSIACIHIRLLNSLIAQICSEHPALSNWTDNDDPNPGNEGESNFPDEANSTDYDDPNSTNEGASNCSDEVDSNPTLGTANSTDETGERLEGIHSSLSFFKVVSLLKLGPSLGLSADVGPAVAAAKETLARGAVSGNGDPQRCANLIKSHAKAQFECCPCRVRSLPHGKHFDL